MIDPAIQSENDPLSAEGFEHLFNNGATVKYLPRSPHSTSLPISHETDTNRADVIQDLQNKLDKANQQLRAARLAKESLDTKTTLLLFLIVPITVAIISMLIFVQSADFIRIQLPGIFSNHMLLQRDQSAIIWGVSNPFSPLTLTLTDCKHKKLAVSTRCDVSGNWKALLPPVQAGGPYQLAIQAIDRIQLDDISFGDVFLMLGQSNLIMPISSTDGSAVESSTHQPSKVWWFQMKPRVADEQDRQTPGTWEPIKHETINNMPAIPYYFAERLKQKSKVPIGLVISGFGGTPINTWLIPTPWQSSKRHYGGWQDSSIFNTMLAPLTGLRVKAMIWYQGEANICNATGYASALTNFIKTLRKSWETTLLPVFVVQLPAFGSRTEFPAESAWAEMREAQAKAATAATASLVVTVDTGQKEEPSIHPKHKLELGQRIADTVFNQLYLKSQNTFPSYDSYKIDGKSIVLSFKCDSELGSSNNNVDLQGFIIAGENKQFVIAQAKLDRSSRRIIVSNPNIVHPRAVRYAWTDNPITPLHDRNKQPIAPFRTDNWPLPHNLKLGVVVCHEPTYSARKHQDG